MKSCANFVKPQFMLFSWYNYKIYLFEFELAFNYNHLFLACFLNDSQGFPVEKIKS